MLDLVFGVMLATSPLNDPMDNTALDPRGAGQLQVVEAIEPAAGEAESAAASEHPFLGSRFTHVGNHR